jgi:hypothetical protein
MARRRPARPREEVPEREVLRLYALLSVRLPAELALDLPHRQERGKSVNAAVIDAIRQYIGRS